MNGGQWRFNVGSHGNIVKGRQRNILRDRQTLVSNRPHCSQGNKIAESKYGCRHLGLLKQFHHCLIPIRECVAPTRDQLSGILDPMALKRFPVTCFTLQGNGACRRRPQATHPSMSVPNQVVCCLESSLHVIREGARNTPLTDFSLSQHNSDAILHQVENVLVIDIASPPPGIGFRRRSSA